jgi:predicted DNA-binding protein
MKTMSANVTLSLPDELYRQAQRLAERSGRNLAEVLTSMLAAAMPTDEVIISSTVERLSDADLLRLCDSEMHPTQAERLSELLARQQAATLNDVEQFELSLLLHRYQEGSLRKAEALAEAVRRGLRPPLDA